MASAIDRAGVQDPGRPASGSEAPAGQASGTPLSAGERPGGQARPSTTGSLANVPPGAATGSSRVLIPAIETARIERGDSLWRISRRTYGEGERYTLIYDANKERIRDPDLIYPGQIFVLPREQAGDSDDGRPRTPGAQP